ncbi:MAG: DUF2379 family protein [Rhodospirillaceae bacterium]|nr:DUF2379 family protein [Rhodospirillaceae bacterium]
MSEAAASEVIAERTLMLDGRPRVTIRIYRPVSEGGKAWCAYEIAGIAGPRGSGRAPGVDTCEALLTALQLCAVLVELSEEARWGRLSWLGLNDEFGLRYSDDPARLRPVPWRSVWSAQDREHVRTGADLGFPRDLETLREWSAMSDEELRGLFGPAAEAILGRLLAGLVEPGALAPVTRDTFPAAVRLLDAVCAEGTHRLNEAMARARDHADAGRLEEARAVMERFIAGSPTRDHRWQAEQYLAGAGARGAGGA